MSSLISKKKLNESYRNTLKDIREDMNIVRKFVSYAIHAPLMDTFLTTLGRTLFRPRPVLYASITALIGMFIFTYNAYSIGYSLSGLELPLLALIGWLIGWTAELPHIYRKYR